METDPDPALVVGDDGRGGQFTVEDMLAASKKLLEDRTIGSNAEKMSIPNDE